MSIEEKRILVGLLGKGMFVSRLDRDWVGTPFPFQGFYITSDEDLELLGLYCTSVFVDVQKGASGPDEPLLSMIRPNMPVFPPRHTEYRNTVPMADELPRAKEVRDDVHSFAERLRHDVRNGEKLSPADVQEAMEPMVASLQRNVDAMFWMVGLMRRDSYAYSHAVKCSALAAAFGRHLALPRNVLVEMATGGFLLDIGKATLPPDVFDHPGELTAEARATVRRHVAVGVRVLDEAGIRGEWIRGMVAQQHERHDERPDVSLAAVPERMLGRRLLLREPAAQQQQQLVAGVGDRVDGLRQHRRGAREEPGDELRDGDAGVREERRDDCLRTVGCAHGGESTRASRERHECRR